MMFSTLKKNLTAYAFIAPALIFIFLFLIWPIIYTGVLSFADYNVFKNEIKGFTFDHYINMAQDEELRITIWNTIIFIIGTVPLTIVFSLFLAVMLNSQIKMKGLFRTVFFMPQITSFAAAGVIFIWMLNPDAERGLVNYVLNMFGISSISWLQSKPWAMIAVMALTIWKNVGYFMIIYIAGLQEIPKSVYEAASIDGASNWQQFRHITVPLLESKTIFIIIMDLIFTFRTFEQIYVMTKGGPSLSTKVLVYYIYELAFGGSFRIGESAAAAMFLLLIVGVIVVLQNKIMKEEYHTATD